MFFHKYNELSERFVTSLLAMQPKAASKSELCVYLSGKSLKLKLYGRFAPRQLEYTFHDKHKLTVIENWTAFDAPYTTMSLGEIQVFTHLLPETSRGYHVFYDRKTELVTVFETWFGTEVPVGGDLFGQKKPTGTRKIHREVQREIYFGFNDIGQPLPRGLHTFTNRMEGKGLHWADDRGEELITFHPSVTCSTFVETGKPWGGITISAPSDYIKISDHQMIYSRGECEYSGTLVMELIDLFEKRAIGVRLGIDENDKLDYIMHKSKIEITGQAAIFEPFTDYGKTPPYYAPDGSHEKGQRMTYRPQDMHPPMTKADVRKAAEKNPPKPFAEESIMSGANSMPPTDFLVGKSFAVKLDNAPHQMAPWAGDAGVSYEYEFPGKTTLKWRVQGGTWQEEEYRAFETNKKLILFAHLCTSDPDFKCLTHAVDFQNGLVTCVEAQIGNWRSEWEAGNRVSFGVIEYPGITPPTARRHHFTDDLVGKSYTWAYSDLMSSIHVYSSPESYSWTIFTDKNAGGSTWSSPCFYIKLRDDAYLFCWIEDLCNGSQGIMVFNPGIMHDAGYFYGASENGIRLSVMGAYARYAGSFDVLKYFGR